MYRVLLRRGFKMGGVKMSLFATISKLYRLIGQCCHVVVRVGQLAGCNRLMLMIQYNDSWDQQSQTFPS